MSDELQQSADALDAFLTARLRGESRPAGDAPPTEAEFGAELLRLAASTEPDPDFRAQLRAQLYRAARDAAARPEPPSFWQRLSAVFGGGAAPGRRLVYTSGALAAVLAVALFGYFVWRSLQGDDVEGPIAEVTPESTAVVQELAALPRLLGPEGGVMGMGGGGDGTDAQLQPAPPIEPLDPFSGTLYILNAELPAEPATATVLQQEPIEWSEQRARQLADQFGFTGPLYMMPPYEPPPGEAVIEFPITYFAFDGEQMLQLDPLFLYYDNPAAAAGGENPTPYDQARPIAETFLTSRGLLTFDYEVRPGFGPGEVNFYRLVDGYAVTQSEAYVRVSNGMVVNASYSALASPQDLGRYPLISAEAAFQKLQQGIGANRLLWEVASIPASEPAVTEAPIAEDQPQSWIRQFTPGAEAHTYSAPTIYLPVEEGGLPRLKLYPLELITDDETIRAIAASPNQMIHFWGTVSADGKSLEVQGWEALDPATFQPIWLEGTVERLEEQLRFTANSGERYILPDAPADVPDGLPASVFGWATRDVGLELPIMDWDSINELVPPAVVEPGVVEEPPVFQPHVYSQFTVDRVELVYYYTYVHDVTAEPTEYAPPTIVLQPVWRFTATGDNGDVLYIYVQAVAPEHLEEPAE
jgi:hypothetical protein